jgi:mannose-6-phosphate isomerase-like protein (cupin superfamily)
MGAWHINNAQEAHSIVAGEGVMEFITQSGVVSVLVEQGDAVLIDKAEHRYLPLTEQTWLIRHGGESDFAFEATETGREPQQWLRP